MELAGIDVQREIAAEQARVVSEALKSAKIDIVGGEAEFFDKITTAITAGKAVDRAVDNSDTLALVEKAIERFTGGGKKKSESKGNGE